MVKIIDQLLPDVFYNRLLKILDDEDKSLNWFWNSKTAEYQNGKPIDNNFMFTHLLYNKDVMNVNAAGQLPKGIDLSKMYNSRQHPKGIQMSPSRESCRFCT